MEPIVEYNELIQIAEKIKNDPNFEKEYNQRVEELKALVIGNAHIIAQQLAAVGLSAVYLDEITDVPSDVESPIECIVPMDLTRIGFIKNASSN